MIPLSISTLQTFCTLLVFLICYVVIASSDTSNSMRHRSSRYLKMRWPEYGQDGDPERFSDGNKARPSMRHKTSSAGPISHLRPSSREDSSTRDEAHPSKRQRLIEWPTEEDSLPVSQASRAVIFRTDQSKELKRLEDRYRWLKSAAEKDSCQYCSHTPYKITT